jgi:hypothetical protein
VTPTEIDMRPLRTESGEMTGIEEVFVEMERKGAIECKTASDEGANQRFNFSRRDRGVCGRSVDHPRKIRRNYGGQAQRSETG